MGICFFMRKQRIGVQWHCEKKISVLLNQLALLAFESDFQISRLDADGENCSNIETFQVDSPGNPSIGQSILSVWSNRPSPVEW